MTRGTMQKLLLAPGSAVRTDRIRRAPMSSAERFSKYSFELRRTGELNQTAKCALAV
jgi:hypothetical protein